MLLFAENHRDAVQHTPEDIMTLLSIDFLHSLSLATLEHFISQIESRFTELRQFRNPDNFSRNSATIDHESFTMKCRAKEIGEDKSAVAYPPGIVLDSNIVSSALINGMYNWMCKN